MFPPAMIYPMANPPKRPNNARFRVPPSGTRFEYPRGRNEEERETVYCANHPDDEAGFYCAKYNRYLCRDCMACQDPTLYCKHRPSCLISEVARHGTPDEQNPTVITAGGSES
jgi:hypothetical protein